MPEGSATARAATSRTDLWDESSLSAARQSAVNCSRSNMHMLPSTRVSRQVYNTASCVFTKSVISINPGACVIANGIFAAEITDCGVTPQAQNTGISSAATGTG